VLESTTDGIQLQKIDEDLFEDHEVQGSENIQINNNDY